MRLTIGLAAMASLCLLAGCNKGAANNSANAPAANAVDANAAAPAATGAASSAHRDNEVRECSSDMASRLSPGADVGAFCGCAVDKVATGVGQRDAIAQCATEQHVTVNLGEAPAGAAPAEGNSAE
jgi:hypothetical protein